MGSANVLVIVNSPDSRAAGAGSFPGARVRFDSAGSHPELGGMIDDLYSAKLLKLAANLPRAGRLSAPDATSEKVSKLCGSRVTVDVKVEGRQVADFAQDVKACALGQAAAGVLGQHVIGASAQEITEARDAMSAMLKAGGEGPSGRFEDLRVLKQVADYPARHASTLVAVEATLEAVNAALAARTRLAGAA